MPCYSLFRGGAKSWRALRATLAAGPGGIRGEDCAVRTERKLVTARSPNQAAYMRALDAHDLVFALGPAGTGKTYLAVAMGVALLKQRRICRPAALVQKMSRKSPSAVRGSGVDCGNDASMW